MGLADEKHDQFANIFWIGHLSIYAACLTVQKGIKCYIRSFSVFGSVNLGRLSGLFHASAKLLNAVCRSYSMSICQDCIALRLYFLVFIGTL